MKTNNHKPRTNRMKTRGVKSRKTQRTVRKSSDTASPKKLRVKNTPDIQEEIAWPKTTDAWV